MIILGTVILIVNLIISIMYKQKSRKIRIILGIISVIAFLSILWGWTIANFLLMDTVPLEGIDKRINKGNIIMILSLLAELLICIKLIIDVLKNRKEGGNLNVKNRK